MESLPVHSYQVHVIAELIESHQLRWGLMATGTYGDPSPGSGKVGMMLRNLSAREVRFPHKSIIGNVQMAEIVLNMKAFKHTSDILPCNTDQPAYLLKFPQKGVDLADPCISTAGIG